MAVFLDRFATLASRLAGRNAYLHHAPLPEQRQAAAAIPQFRPIEAVVDVKNLPLDIARIPRSGADKVHSFDRQKQFIAKDRVKRGKLFPHMPDKVIGMNTHVVPVVIGQSPAHGEWYTMALQEEAKPKNGPDHQPARKPRDRYITERQVTGSREGAPDRAPQSSNCLRQVRSLNPMPP